MGALSSLQRIDCKRVFTFERIASFVFAAAGLCVQLTAFVNLKSKEGHFLCIFSASRGLVAYYILMYPMWYKSRPRKRQCYAFTIIRRTALCKCD